MSFFQNKRILMFLVMDAAVLLGVIAVFASVNHSFGPQKMVLSERVFATPEPPDTTQAPGSTAVVPAVRPVPATTKSQPSTFVLPRTDDPNQPILVAGPDDSIDLRRLICKKVTVTVHPVKLKENYWTIKNDFNIDIYTLIGANPDMPFTASINQKLNLLSRKGVLHTVEKGETPSVIAALYKVPEKTIKDENGLGFFKGLRTGDVIFIPDVKPIRMTEQWSKYFSQRGIFGIPFAGWGKGWTSKFGWRTDPITGEEKMHKGMDFKAKYGDKVYAAATGRVIFAGVSGGYGNLIQIRHSSTYITYYGHLSKILIKQGQKVRRGQLIGNVGATGRVTGPHLHFEIRRNGVAIDPLPLI